MAEILDQFGRPLKRVSDKDLLDRQAVASFGSIRQIQSGHPAENLNPERLAAILHEAETGDATAYLELAEQMEEKDLHYAAVLGVRKRGVRALEVQVDPGDDSAIANEAADMVRQTLSSSAVKLALIDMMDALGKGFSVSEIVWEREGKGLKIAGLEPVDPRWFEFDQQNGRHLYLRDNAGPQPLRADSYVIHLAKTKSGLPIRGGLARLAAWAYMFKNFALKDWAIFCEAYGHPLRLGKYDTASSPEDRRTLLRAVRQIGVDMAAIIPKTMEVDIVSASSTGADKLYEGKARYWDEQVSKGVLGQVATTDAIAGGHAVGKIHEQVRDDIRDADAEQLAGSLQRDLAGALIRVHFAEGHLVPLPVIRFVAPERADPKLMLDLMERGPRAGLRIAVADVRKVFAIREPEPGEEVLTAPTPEPAALARADLAPRLLASKAPASSSDSIDALVDELINAGEMQRVVAGEIGDLVEALGVATDFDQVRDILASFRSAAPGPLVDLLTGSTFAARVAGEVGAPIRD